MNAPSGITISRPEFRPPQHNLNELQVMAEAVAQSGLFGMKSYQQALALMLIAQSEHQHPASITQDYDIIQGKACRKTNSVMARFQQMGGRIEWHQLTNEIADATFSHASAGSLRLSWTIEQAKKANLTGKDVWKNYPRAMLRARLIAEGVRAVYPAAIGGMLLAEEAQDLPPTVERDMGPVAVVNQSTGEILPPTPATYPQADFDKNLATWQGMIRDGKTTASRLIAKITTKAPLTEDQAEILKNTTTEGVAA